MTETIASTNSSEGTLHARRAWVVPSAAPPADPSLPMMELFESMGLARLVASCRTVLVRPGAGWRDWTVLRALCDRLFETAGQTGEVVIGGRRRELAPIMDWPAEYASRGCWLTVVDLGRTDGPFRRCAISLGPDALHRVGRADGQGAVSREYVVAGDVLAAQLVISISPANGLEALADIEAVPQEKETGQGGWPAILDKNRILLYADARGVLTNSVQRLAVTLTVRPDCFVASLNPLAAAVAESRLRGGSLTAAATAFGLVRYPLAAFDRAEVEVAGWPGEERAA